MSRDAVFETVRASLLPMLRSWCERLADAPAPGYPLLLDDPGQGQVGIVLAPGFSWSLEEGPPLRIRATVVRHRTFVHSAASRPCFGGQPAESIRVLSEPVSVTELRDELARFVAHWLRQPLVIRQSDS